MLDDCSDGEYEDVGVDKVDAAEDCWSPSGSVSDIIGPLLIACIADGMNWDIWPI